MERIIDGLNIAVLDRVLKLLVAWKFCANVGNKLFW
jgi:hypothetical protein